MSRRHEHIRIENFRGDSYMQDTLYDAGIDIYNRMINKHHIRISDRRLNRIMSALFRALERELNR
jgi:hypothetical protein